MADKINSPGFSPVNTPVLAVVIPCYNVARHIEEVITTLPDSVSYIIPVNDCSKDDTESVLVRLANEKRKARLRVDTQPREFFNLVSGLIREETCLRRK